MGLAHDNTGRQIMDPDFLATNDNKVRSTALCNTFRTDCGNGDKIWTGISEVGFASALDPTFEVSSGMPLADRRPENDFSAVPIGKLVAGSFMNSVQPEVEDYYDESDANVLRSDLANPARKDRPRMAATLLGLISTSANRSRRSLLEYLAQPEADASAAMMALGYLVARLGDEPALMTLAESFVDGDVATREAAALGLTLSGDLRAYDLLRDAASNETNSVRRMVLNEQASECERVGLIGLREHYANPPQPVWLDVPDQGLGIGGPVAQAGK
jgi:hypothetical protein